MKTQDEYLKELLDADPKAAHTMRAINGVGLSIEGLVEPAHHNVLMRKGIIAGMAATIPLVDQVKAEVQKEIDDGILDGDAAKVVLHWLSRVQEHLDSSKSMNQRELAVQEGIIEGLKKAALQCESLYAQEETKTKQRANEAYRGNRDDGGRPRPIREIREELAKEDEPKAKKRRATKKRSVKKADARNT